MKLEGKRFLVIGGGGLIGSHTVEELLRHPVESVVVYDNFTRGTLDNLAGALADPRASVFPAGGDICQTDILDEAFDGVDGVFHFAALWLLHCHEYPKSAFEVNVGGTFNVLNACRRHSAERLVYSSSASVYGDAVEEPMTEDHPFKNETFYGATKISGEAMAHAFHKRYGLSYAGLRYMNVYGPRQDYRGAYIAVIMKMLDAIDLGQPLTIFGDGSQAYDFIHVRDCARANVAAMASDVDDEYFNVGTGVRTSILELANLLLELTESESGLEFESAGLTFVKNRIGDPTKATEMLGFTADTNLREGLASVISWRRDHIRELEERRRQSSS